MIFIYVLMGLCVVIIVLCGVIFNLNDLIRDLESDIEILDGAVNQLYSEIFGDDYCDCESHEGLTIL